MTRIFTDGAEMGDLLFLDTGGSLTVSSSQARTGTYAYFGANAQNATKTFTGASEIYTRFCIRTDATPLNTDIFVWRNGGTTLGSLRLNTTTKKLEVYVSGSLVVTGTNVIQLNAWTMIEVHVLISDSGIIETKVEGLLDATYSGDTKPGSATTIDNFNYRAIQGASNCYFDDLACNNTSGAVDNSWCGDGHVIALVPNADGDVTQLVGSDGNQTNNYLLVDETPANGDTDYVVGSGINQYDLYNFSNSGLTGVTIRRAWAESRARDTVAAGALTCLTIKTNSTEYDGTDRSLITSYTIQILGDDYDTNPNTGNPWTISEIDALQAGPKVRS